MALRRVCVYCGSSRGVSLAYQTAAEELADELVRRHLGLVFGGSDVGLMGVLADAVMARGGEVIGVIPAALVDKELAHGAITQLRVVGSMHERKAEMAELVDAFVALPGGFGTLEEFAEAVTWNQLGFHAKPCGLLDTSGYYQPLLAWFDHAVGEGFIKGANRSLVIHAAEAGTLLDLLERWRPTPVEGWIAPATGLEP